MIYEDVGLPFASGGSPRQHRDSLSTPRFAKCPAGKSWKQIELENTKTGERRVVRTPAVFSMIGAKPCTEWLPPEIERDAKGFIKTGMSVAGAPAWKASKHQPGPLETSLPGNFCRRRRPFRFGQTLCRRSRRRRHGHRGRANEIGRIKLSASHRRSNLVVRSSLVTRHFTIVGRIGASAWSSSLLFFCPLTSDSLLPFRLNAFEQFGVRSIPGREQISPLLAELRDNLETFSQFPGRRIVKERNVLIQIRHN